MTGAGRMRSIGRPIAVELARAGCDIVLTGTGRSPDRYPDDEKAAGWRDIESVAEEVRALGRRARHGGLRRRRPRRRRGARRADDGRARPRRHRRQQRRRQQGRGPQAGDRPRPGAVAHRHQRQPDRVVPDVEGVRAAARRRRPRRLDRQHLLDRRQGAEPDDVRLRRVEGRHPRPHRVHVRRGRPVRHPRQRHLPRRHRHVADGRPRARRGLGPARRHADPDGPRRHRRGHRLRRRLPVLGPGGVGDRARPGTSTAAPSCNTEPHGRLRHPDHADRALAGTGPDAPGAVPRGAAQRPRRRHRGVAGPRRRADRGADALQPVRPAWPSSCGGRPGSSGAASAATSARWSSRARRSRRRRRRTAADRATIEAHKRDGTPGPRGQHLARPGPPADRARGPPRRPGRPGRAVHPRPARGRHGRARAVRRADPARRVERSRLPVLARREGGQDHRAEPVVHARGRVDEPVGPGRRAVRDGQRARQQVRSRLPRARPGARAVPRPRGAHGAGPDLRRPRLRAATRRSSGSARAKRTESYWTETTITDPETRDLVAVVVLHQGVFKQSYAGYPQDRLG